jgi:hypothetical protein
MRPLEQIFVDLRNANMEYSDAVNMFGSVGARFAGDLPDSISSR